MEDKKLSAQESFDLINKMIDKTKERYEENGLNVTLWGIAVMVAGIGQYLIIGTKYYEQSFWIWALTMIPLFLYTMFDGYRSGKRNKYGGSGWDVTSVAWFMAGTMAMVSGFLMGGKLGSNQITVMMLPFCVAAAVSGHFLKKPLFVVMAVISALVSYGALFLPWKTHPLVVAFIACILFFIPGLILMRDYRRRNV